MSQTIIHPRRTPVFFTTLWVVLPFSWRCDAFIISPTPPCFLCHGHSFSWLPRTVSSSHRQHRLYMSQNMKNGDTIDGSNDPFVVLGLEEPTSDLKVIKRAYKRMALQYHPDVATNQQSTPAEKKAASDRFAKINWAYEVLSGKRSNNDSTYGTPSSSTASSNGRTSSSSSSSSSSGWTPPHRRSGAYSTSSSSRSSSGDNGVDWRDFMPNNNEETEQYDAGGDSFGKIFSDLFVGAAMGMASGGGPTSLFKDFIDFLEGNVDGFGSDRDGDNDAELQVLLRTGSFDEIRNELDDTELIVQQLTQKARGIQDEIISLTAKASTTTRYMEKLEMEESLDELNARNDVVKGYIKKAQKRLLALQVRYKELLTGGENSSYRQSTRSSWYDIKREAGSPGGVGDRSSGSSSSQSSPSSSYDRTTSSDSTTSSSTSSASSTSYTSSQSDRVPNNEEDAWMKEGFGSSTYGRGRGSGRRRARGTTTSTTKTTETTTPNSSSQKDASTTSSSSPNPQRSTSYASSSSSSGPGATSSGAPSTRVSSSPSSTTGGTSSQSSSSIQSLSTLPPHRRTTTTTSYESRQQQDQRRMRELKVDEEFDKLKQELGL